MGNTPEFWKEQWSRLWTPQGNPMSGPILEKVLKYLPQGGSFLDVGSGDGRFAFLVAAARPDVTVVGVDFDSDAVRRTNELVAPPDRERLRFLVGDAFHLEQLSVQFDVVLSNGMIEHYDRDKALELLKAVSRVTSPEGHALIGVPNRLCIPHEILKWVQGPNYRYFPETSYYLAELAGQVASAGLVPEALFGVVPEWAIQRMDFAWKPFGWIGKALRPLRQIVDWASDNAFSLLFGYEIFVVGRKPQ